jgi:hypothetical protein
MKKISLALILLALLLAGCSTSAGHATARSSPTAAPASPTDAPPGPLGAANCQPASPVDESPVGPEAQGTGTNAEVWALLQATDGLPIKAGTPIKIVWRMTGTGDFHLLAIGPQGQQLTPSWGPEAHDGSNWNRPGDEWGAGYDSLPVAGCWDFHVTRDHASGDVWLVIVK